jgi:hypothetical protein
MKPTRTRLSFTSFGSEKMTEVEIKEVIGNEVLLVLPFGEVAAKLPKSFKCNYKFGDLQAIERAYNDMCAWIEQSGSFLVPVVSAGRGKTDKSRKIRVRAIFQSRESQHEEVAREHTITVPVSLLTQRPDGLYAPRWLVSRTLHDRLPGNKWPLRVEGGIWEGREQLWNEVFAPLAAEVVERAQRIARKEAIVRQEKEKTKQAEHANKQHAQNLAQQDNLAQQRQQREQKIQAKRAKLESLTVERVEWDEWVKVRRGYGNKSLEKETRMAENCLLQFSGQRVYINLPNGHVVIKFKKNVRFAEEGFLLSGRLDCQAVPD